MAPSVRRLPVSISFAVSVMSAHSLWLKVDALRFRFRMQLLPLCTVEMSIAARSHLPLNEHLLDLSDGLGRVEVLRAGLGAIQDGMAAVEPERVFKIVEPLAT